MIKKNIFRLPKLKRQLNLIHGIFGKEFGNISFKYGDKKAVRKNREKICSDLKIKAQDLYEMEQISGSKIKILGYKDIKRLKNNLVPGADGLITNKKEIYLMVKTADCFPIILFDPIKKVIGVLHVGKKGLEENILLKGRKKLIKYFGVKAENILVGIGPGIYRCCYKYKKFFQENSLIWKAFLKKENNQYKSLDLFGFIINQLAKLGIRKENIESANICTACSSQYFSHFRCLQKKQKEGRFATIIGLKAKI